jgi:hypothetical protein
VTMALRSCRPVQLRAVFARALEVWIFGNHGVAALLANVPVRALQHRAELIVECAVRAANDLFYHSWAFHLWRFRF